LFWTFQEEKKSLVLARTQTPSRPARTKDTPLLLAAEIESEVND
jgi:hypothetical protein